MTDFTSKTIAVPPGLEDSDYIRERLSPQPGQHFYLHLSDLKAALLSAIPAESCRVLDYGCGGSPYRSLFNASSFHRADIEGTPNIDFPFQADSRIEAGSLSYDCVLSTQVLEHVQDYGLYLSESFRVLRPGGRLILTTHGNFPEHGCPYDFRRWTADGLRYDLVKAGFKVERITKLTTGPRALVFLNSLYNRLMVVEGRSWFALIWRLGRLPFRARRAVLDVFTDRQFRKSGTVPETEPGHEFYIALMVVASRPD
jgi:SAM-dependent methyltransferase